MNTLHIERPLELVTQGVRSRAQSIISFYVQRSQTAIGAVEVYSYETLIATLQPRKRLARIDLRKYSRTTTRQQKAVLAWLNRNQYQVTQLSEELNND